MKRNGKILIVDDEKVNCNVLVSLLDEYDTTVAKNGEQALDRALSTPEPDLILLDVMMPEINGYEVCQRLKADDRTKNIPIIFITVKATEAEETKGLKLGAVDYISKPFSPAIVLARVSNHMELKRQRDLLEHLNITDALTGIPNRRRFDISLEHEWQAAVRMGGELSILMIDIDHFKPYNDIYGHAAGDDCLMKVAKRLDCVCGREIDLLTRYGGEEFAAILPGTDIKGAMTIAEAMRDAVSELNIPHEGSSTAEHVTISLGVSSGNKNNTNDAPSLLKQADEALYKVKENGRNNFST